MSHQIRYVPPDESGWTVVEVCARCTNGTFLLAPSAELRENLLGIIGRAQRLTGTRIYLPDYQVNHYHMLIGVRDAGQMAEFMYHVQHKTSVELRILRGWKGPKWETPYKPSCPGRDPEDLARRFRYVLAQGCAAGLVSSPRKWPGVSAGGALWDGRLELHGKWIDRTALRRAKRTRAGRRLTAEDFKVEETVFLSKLPGFDHLSDEEYCGWVRQMIVEIEEKTRARHEREGTRPQGQWKLSRLSPFRTPKAMTLGPRPRVIARNPEERARLLAAFDWVFRAHRRARDRQRAGDLEAQFPEGTFPSPLPYVMVQAMRAGP